MESGLRTNKSLNSSNPHLFPKRTSSALPIHPALLPTAENVTANTSRQLTGPASRANRRQSLSSYIPGGSSGVSDSDQMKPRPKSFYRGAGSRNPGLFISTKHAEQYSPEWDTTSPDHSPALTYSSRTPQSVQTPRDSAAVAKRKAGFASPGRSQEEIMPADHFQYRLNDRPASAHRPNSHRGSVQSSAFTFPSKRPVTRHSLQTFPSSIPPSLASRETTSDVTTLAYPRTKLRSSKADAHVDVAVNAHLDAAPPPCQCHIVLLRWP